MKTKFATERLHHVYEDLKQIGELLDDIQKEALDPHIVRTQSVKAERLRLAVLEQIKHGIEPLLERAAPPLEKRVTGLEEQVQTLEAQMRDLLRLEMPAEKKHHEGR